MDRWIQIRPVNKPPFLFQTEVKSWTGHAIGGQPITPEIALNNSRMKEIRTALWHEVWHEARNRPRKQSVGKVLTRMENPSEAPKLPVRPLLIFWWPIHPQGQPESWFERDIERNSDFKKLYFFSASTYLRSLGTDHIILEVPKLAARLKWLQRICPTTRAA